MKWRCCACCRTLPDSVGCGSGVGWLAPGWVGHLEPCEEHQAEEAAAARWRAGAGAVITPEEAAEYRRAATETLPPAPLTAPSTKPTTALETPETRYT